MTLGNQIVAELGRRHLVGQFFDYAGYQKIRRIENRDQLRQFLEERNYQSPPTLETASEVVDYLVAVNSKMELEEGKWMWAACLSGLIVPLVDLFFWLGALVLRLNRKSRKRL